MRLANLNGRATIMVDGATIDVNDASKGYFPFTIDDCLPVLDELDQWHGSGGTKASLTTSPERWDDYHFGPVVSTPQQIFAIGLNYRHHALEMGLALPTTPMVFTKWASSLCGANDVLPIPTDTTDYEAELVVVIGQNARHVAVEDALGVVAGYCVGQDYSERALQMAGSPAQFSLGKSFRNFAPVGPWLTTASDVPDPNNLSVQCHVNGDVRQDSNTSDMVFSVQEIVSYLSSVVELRVGDLIFTGSPDGVGQGRSPQMFLRDGDVVTTTIGNLGQLRNTVVNASV